MSRPIVGVLALALIVSSAPASAARIIVSCYDGSSSTSVAWGKRPGTTRIGGCDLDGQLNGACHFRVNIAARSRELPPRLFDVTVDAGRRQRLRYGGTRALLRCRAGPEPSREPPCKPEAPPGARTFSCRDSVV